MKSWVALVALGAISLAGIFDHDLWTPDEPRDAEIAREMADGGSWLVPTLNREPHMEKPPLFFWSVASVYEVLGARAWTARIASVLFGWGTLAFTFLLARRMFGRDVGVRAALLLGTTWIFFVITHRCTVDNALLFFVTGAFYWMHRGFVSERKIGFYLLGYLFTLGAFLSKGLIGPGFVGAGFFVFLLWNRSPRELLRAHPWLAILLVGGGAALWLLSLPEELRKTVLVYNNLGRFTGGEYEGGHKEPFYYYLLAYWYALAPWGCLLPAVVPWIRKNANPSTRFLISWFAVGFLALCAAATKREIYLLPLAPAIAILVAAWMPARFDRAPAILAAVAALAVSIAFPILDRTKSMKPFCTSLPPMESVPVWNPDESTLAVVNFYARRPVRPIETEAEAARLAETRPAVIVVVEKRDRHRGLLSHLFPHEWLVHDASRRMVLRANVPRP